MNWTETLAELIRRTTSDLPSDVEAALQAAAAAEAPQSQAAVLLHALTENTALARAQATPLCQDTGTLTFFWNVPRGADTSALEVSAREAVALATRRGWLRRNTIDTLSGRSVDTNVAEGCPVCHFEQRSAIGDRRSDSSALRLPPSDLCPPTSDLRSTEVWLLQKGGGSENMSAQFSLPDGELGAGRDLDGVRRCVLQAVWRAQGFGCAPGILGVCVGADRAEGFLTAKRQLLRPLGDASPEPDVAALERRVLAEANALGIGPMGLGGKTTLLGVKIAVRTRLPASYFVTVAYMCWACRRRGVRVTDGRIEWLG
jgi:fumarate hydratase class I